MSEPSCSHDLDGARQNVIEDCLQCKLSQCEQTIRELVNALNVLSDFDSKNFDELEKVYGFLGWTRQGQMETLASVALSKVPPELRT